MPRFCSIRTSSAAFARMSASLVATFGNASSSRSSPTIAASWLATCLPAAAIAAASSAEAGDEAQRQSREHARREPVNPHAEFLLRRPGVPRDPAGAPNRGTSVAKLPSVTDLLPACD